MEDLTETFKEFQVAQEKISGKLRTKIDRVEVETLTSQIALLPTLEQFTEADVVTRSSLQ